MKIWFGKIQVEGAHHIPKNGPVILAGNHQNALVDAMLLTSICPRNIRILAKEPIFRMAGIGLAAKMIQAIPVYRAQDNRGEKQDNSSMYEAVYTTLKNQECIALFPEGVSHVMSDLKELKTGIARMALGVVARYPEVKTIKIIPVGLNYVCCDKFRSKVLINFGKPIQVTELLVGLYNSTSYVDTPRLSSSLKKAHGDLTTDEKFMEPKRLAVNLLMKDIKSGLQSVHVSAPDWETLRSAILTLELYAPTKKVCTHKERAQMAIMLSKGYEKVSEKEDIVKLKKGIVQYQKTLDEIGIRDKEVRTNLGCCKRFLICLKNMFYLTFIIPLSFPGLILNLPTLLFANLLRCICKPEKDVVGSTFIVYVPMFVIALYSVYVVGFTIPMHIFLYQYTKIHGAIWFLIALIAVPVTSYTALRVSESGFHILRRTYYILSLGCVGNQIWNKLVDSRKKLKRAIRDGVEKYGGDLLENRVIPLEELTPRTPREYSFVDEKPLVHDAQDYNQEYDKKLDDQLDLMDNKK